jgi:hypothetical protein
MMLRRIAVAMAVVLAVVSTTALTPRRAAAIDNLEYIIPAAIGGAAALALVIAILMADRTKEPELDLVAHPGLGARGLAPFGVEMACRSASGEIAWLCW